MNYDETLLGDDCYVYYHKGYDTLTYVEVRYDKQSVLLTLEEALTLLKWLQEQQGNIEELQRQEQQS